MMRSCKPSADWVRRVFPDAAVEVRWSHIAEEWCAVVQENDGTRWDVSIETGEAARYSPPSDDDAYSEITHHTLSKDSR